MEQAHHSIDPKRNARASAAFTLTGALTELKKFNQKSASLITNRIEEHMPCMLDHVGEDEAAHLVKFFSLAPKARSETEDIVTERQITFCLRDEHILVPPTYRTCIDRFIQKVMCYDDDALSEVSREAFGELIGLVTKIRKRSGNSCP